jgi:hypothetical protein
MRQLMSVSNAGQGNGPFGRETMPVYYFVIEEDDVWRIRKRGRSYGGYLTREQAVRAAMQAAGRCRDEAHVVVQQTGAFFSAGSSSGAAMPVTGGPAYRIEWSNRRPATPITPAALAQMALARLGPMPGDNPVGRAPARIRRVDIIAGRRPFFRTRRRSEATAPPPEVPANQHEAADLD